jgi:hypothetical protein
VSKRNINGAPSPEPDENDGSQPDPLANPLNSAPAATPKPKAKAKPPKPAPGTAPLSEEPEFDPDHYAVKQDFDQLAISRHIFHIPIAKPNAQTWFMLHPDPAWRMSAYVVADQADRNILYVLDPSIADDVLADIDLVDSVTTRIMVPYVTSAGDYGVWAFRKPNDPVRDTYATSALAILKLFARPMD